MLGVSSVVEYAFAFEAIADVNTPIQVLCFSCGKAMDYGMLV